jgi:lambda family phage portal protein
MISDALGAAIDNFIGIFAPKSALVRKFHRKKLQATRSATYAAADTNRMTGGWTPTSSSVNDIIGNSAVSVRNRIRQLVRDFPYFAKAINAICDYTVGAGITYEPRVTLPNDPEVLDTKTNQKIEDAVDFWAEKADIAGRLHYYEIMELMKRQDVESGEFIVVKRLDKRPGRYIPLSLQIYEADWLDSTINFDQNANTKIEQGIEYNVNTGAVVNYHFTDPDSWGKSIKIPASAVVHGFKTLRPGQLRGISPFTSGVLMAHDLLDFMNAEVDAAKMAAKYLAFVESPDLASRQILLDTDEEDSTKKIDEMENAIIEYLDPGERVEIAKNPRPGESFSPFVRLMLTMLSVVTNVPYEILTGDYKGLNYSTGRMVRNDFAQQLRPISMRHIRHFGIPTIHPVIDMAVMAGKLDLPNYFTQKARYLKAEWQPPGMESIDPLRESKAHVEQLNALLRSPQEIARARGRKLEDIYKEIKRAMELAEQMGLPFNLQQISTALANNPAAVAPDKKASIISLRK